MRQAQLDLTRYALGYRSLPGRGVCSASLDPLHVRPATSQAHQPGDSAARLLALEEEVARLRAELALPPPSPSSPTALSEPPSVGTWRFDPGNGRLWWSPRVFELIGLERATEPPDAETVMGLLHPDDVAEVQRLIEDMLTDARLVTRFDCRIRRVDGAERHMSVTVQERWRAPDGRLLLSGVVFDVTAEKAREAEVARALAHLEALERLNALLREDLSPRELVHRVIGFVLDHFAADRVALLHHDVPGSPFVDLMGVRDRNGEREARTPLGGRLHLPSAAALDGMAPSQILHFGPDEERPVPPDVAELGVRSVVLARLRAGRGASWLVALQYIETEHAWSDDEDKLFRDVVQRIESAFAAAAALDELASSQARLESVLEAVPEIIFQIDRTGLIIAVHASDRDNLERVRARLVGQRLTEVFPRDGAALVARVVECLESGKVLAYPRYRLPMPRGEEVFSARIAPLGAAAPDQVLWVARNITAEDRLEEQLRHTQKLESLGVLAGGIAHDFNNFLAAILGNVNLLTEDAGAQCSPLLGEIARAARRGADLCAQLLAYSGKGRFTIEAVDLNALVEDMATILKVSLSKKARVQIELMPSLPHVEGDRAQLQQVVMNLLINASEALDGEAGDIHVSTRVWACEGDEPCPEGIVEPLTPGRYVILEVSDSGRGMDAATRERIFEPFFSTKFAGRGLGLAAVLGVVRGHRGSMSVRSTLGAGSSFSVYVPVSARAPRQLPRSSRNERPAAGRAGRVLLADDDDAVRLVCLRALRRAGYLVTPAQDGAEAVACFAEQPMAYDAVVLDLTMPELGGTEVFSRVKAMREDVPVILMSGYNEHEVVGHFAHNGLAGFLAKPFSTQELVAAVDAVIAPPPAD
ncbi:MAG: response regulator [Deltaproteobacteria bacterium]|nr:MAG: response regulator [Deltaproteobacteria bacterium]